MILSYPAEKDNCPENYQYHTDNHSDLPLVLCPHVFSPFRRNAIRNKKGDKDKGKDIYKVIENEPW
jgi:hypothetical protein